MRRFTDYSEITVCGTAIFAKQREPRTKLSSLSQLQFQTSVVKRHTFYVNSRFYLNGASSPNVRPTLHRNQIWKRVNSNGKK